jgi:fructuronate reductase
VIAFTLHRATPAPPVRIVHLGLGAFSRSHTAWYTHASPDAGEWGIAAYTGRSHDLSDRLTAQEGLYTLIERDEKGDQHEVIGSIVRAHPGDDITSLMRDISAPETAIVTLTITEVGYRLRTADVPDDDDPLVSRDRDELSSVARGRTALAEARPETALGRLLLGLEARRRTGGGPLAVVSCDNLPDNGARLRRGLTAWTRDAAPDLCQWLVDNVSFVSSSVDRITPRITAREADALSERYADRAPVVAEPFRDWILSGRFPAGRPTWEAAGARFVEDLEPWEARKLWLLNGAHTLLACLGLLRGHRTVADAIADPVCRSAVEQLWDDAQAALPSDIDVAAYRAALLARFSNPRIEHLLVQIGQETDTKIRLRIAPVAEIALREGRDAPGCAFALASWIAAQVSGLIPGGTAGTAHTGSIVDHVTRVSAHLGVDRGFVTQVGMLTEALIDNETDTTATISGNRLSNHVEPDLLVITDPRAI